MPPSYSWVTVVGTCSATSDVTLTSNQDSTAENTITPTISPRKMIAGCGTLLPTRSTQPRKPPEPVPSSSAAAALIARSLPGSSNGVASSISSFAPKPLAPLLRQSRTAGCWAVPAMSTCAHGVSSTNSSRKSAAVIDPALTPPMLVRSAIAESSWVR